MGDQNFRSLLSQSMFGMLPLALIGGPHLSGFQFSNEVQAFVWPCSGRVITIA